MIIDVISTRPVPPRAMLVVQCRWLSFLLYLLLLKQLLRLLCRLLKLLLRRLSLLSRLLFLLLNQPRLLSLLLTLALLGLLLRRLSRLLSLLLKLFLLLCPLLLGLSLLSLLLLSLLLCLLALLLRLLRGLVFVLRIAWSKRALNDNSQSDAMPKNHRRERFGDHDSSLALARKTLERLKQLKQKHCVLRANLTKS